MFRQLWGEHLVSTETPLPQEIQAEIVAEDQVEYIGSDGGKQRCATLRHILQRDVQGEDGDDSLALEIFEHIWQSNQRVFRWEVRGPALFRFLTNRPCPGDSFPQRFFEPTGLAEGETADLIFVAEYDIHYWPEKLDFLGDGTKRSFPEAMQAVGYHAVLFDDPKSTGEGCGLFVKASVFGLQDAATEDGPAQLHAVVGEKRAGSQIESVDFHELWHPKQHMPPVREEMPKVDRKNCGLCRLDILNPASAGGVTGLVICGVHLMTTSRDNSSKVHYPGEVRAHQLETLRSIAKQWIRPGDAAILCGDFNINIRGNAERHVLEGVISADRPAEGVPPSVQFRTGFSVLEDRETMELCWQRTDDSDIILHDAYAGINWHTEDEMGNTLGTSHNASRIETIDYVWYDSESLSVVAKSPITAVMPDGTPDEQNPSDHIPLVVRFAFKNQPAL